MRGDEQSSDNTTFLIAQNRSDVLKIGIGSLKNTR